MTYSLITKVIIICAINTFFLSGNLSANPHSSNITTKNVLSENIMISEKSGVTAQNSTNKSHPIEALFATRFGLNNIQNEPLGSANAFIVSFMNNVQNDCHWKSFYPGTNTYVFDDSLLSENNLHSDDAELKEVENIKRDIAMSATWGAINDMFKQTPLGKSVVKAEQTIANYLVIEYSKGLSNEEAKFFLPGQVAVEKPEGKKAYRFTLSPVFYTDPNKLTGQFSIIFDFNWHNNLTKGIYDSGEREFTFNFENESLNNYLGKKVSLCLIRNEFNESIGLLKVSMEF